MAAGLTGRVSKAPDRKEEETTMTSSVLIRLTELRAAHARRRALWRELSSYTTPSDLTDIEAAIARCGEAEDDPATQQVRRIIAVQRVGHAA